MQKMSTQLNQERNRYEFSKVIECLEKPTHIQSCQMFEILVLAIFTSTCLL